MVGWGNNEHGELGGGDTESREVPTLVRGELQDRNVLQVAAGAGHIVCVTAEGAVFAFGCNSFGQLGFGDTGERNVPTLLRGELENKPVMQVAAGAGHTVFVTRDGLVFACGGNDAGQLGVGDTGDNVMVPTLVTGQLQGKTAVYTAAGDDHTLCITADGSLFSWGANSSSNGYGQLGVGDTEDKHVPTLVTGLQGKRLMQICRCWCGR